MIPRLDGQPAVPAAGVAGSPTAPAADSTQPPAAAPPLDVVEVLPGSPASDGAYALAALVTALEEGSGRAATAGQKPWPDVAALLARAAGVLGEGQMAALVRLLEPLDPSGGANLARALRSRLESGGALLEAHLRGILEENALLAPDEALARLKGADVRVLVGRLLQAIGRDPSAEATRKGVEGLADRLLDRQLLAAYDRVRDGTVSFDVPLRLDSEETRAFVRFRRDDEPRAAAGAEHRDRACTLAVHVDSRSLGPIEATARWQGAACEAVVYVANATAAAVLHDEVETLRAGLGASFSRVAVEVVIDAARAASRPATPGVEHLPGGSIVNVRT